MPVELEIDQMLPWGLIVQQHFNEQIASLNSEGKGKERKKSNSHYLFCMMEGSHSAWFVSYTPLLWGARTELLFKLGAMEGTGYHPYFPKTCLHSFTSGFSLNMIEI